MDFLRSYRKRFVVFLIVCILVVSTGYILTIMTVPGQITLLEGEEYSYNFKSLFPLNIKADIDGIVSLDSNGKAASGGYYRLSGPLKLKTEQKGSVNLYLKLFGLLPLKKMRVDVLANRSIAACGNTIGVKLKIDGILIIGISDVEAAGNKRVLPVKDSGIKAGDTLVRINGEKLENIDQLIEEINKSNGKTVKLTYKHDEIYREVEVKPVKSIDDNKYHIGLWVRDNTAGIGTLTFYDPKTGYFGALGHGITDIDTGTLMPAVSGEILESSILGIKKSKPGMPGELKGIFIEDRNQIGSIFVNGECGIYGKLNDMAFESIPGKLYPVGLRSQITEGPAKILSNIDGKDVCEYDVEIQRISRQNLNGSKGMIIKITDKRLLEETGGIVQGMSGSPIIQNGRIVGAVTHVLVNDPTRGYGIFIEGMLRNLTDNSFSEYEKAG